MEGGKYIAYMAGNSKVLLAILWLLFGQWSIAHGQSSTEAYKKAASLYKANQFEQAAQQYELIVKEGYKNAEVYYNLGNCYYKLNSIGKAILYYERAQQLAPEDEDIAYNLKLANLKTVDRLIPVPQLGIITGWNHFIKSHSAKGWGVFAVVSVWLALVFAAVYFFVGIRKVSATLGVLSVVLSIAFISLAFKQHSREQDPHEAVLMVTSTNIKSAPAEDATNLFMIHEGLKFTILDNVGAWYKVRLADGKVGWLERSNFEKI